MVGALFPQVPSNPQWVSCRAPSPQFRLLVSRGVRLPVSPPVRTGAATRSIVVVALHSSLQLCDIGDLD